MRHNEMLWERARAVFSAEYAEISTKRHAGDGSADKEEDTAHNKILWGLPEAFRQIPDREDPES